MSVKQKIGLDELLHAKEGRILLITSSLGTLLRHRHPPPGPATLPDCNTCQFVLPFLRELAQLEVECMELREKLIKAGAATYRGGSSGGKKSTTRRDQLLNAIANVMQPNNLARWNSERFALWEWISRELRRKHGLNCTRRQTIQAHLRTLEKEQRITMPKL